MKPVCSVFAPYLLRTKSVSSPYQVRAIGYGDGTEQIRSRYGVDTEQVRRLYKYKNSVFSASSVMKRIITRTKNE